MEGKKLNDKIYNPKELNNLLLNETVEIASKFPEINIMGDINSFNKWKRSGCSFKITMNNESIECKAWERDGLIPDEIKSYENTQCIIKGIIVANYFHGHKFVINVNSITLINNDTKLKEVKLICQDKGYFENKKIIEWTKIKKIGIISKKNTQGYDDFCNQFNVPLELHLEQITLEGKKTYKECIESIKKLQHCDLILIIRGGGDTREISNSFDNIKLFDSIKNSKIPIVTAIGHEQDKDDKLLITNISDIDFPTPTALAKDLNSILYKPLLEKLDILLESNEELFYNLLEKENNKLYEALKIFLEKFLKNKFGGKIIDVDNNEDNIIIKKNGKFYNIKLNLDEELNFTNKDINLKDNLIDAIQDEDINIINKTFCKLNTDSFKLSDNILDNIKKIQKNTNLENKFLKTQDNKNTTNYLKNIKKNNFPNLIKIKEILLWYSKKIKESIDGIHIQEIKEIYYFIL